jgi:hypothetical protein
MPLLFFTDGTLGEIGYSKAAEINDILDGYAKPKNEEQAEFISRIKYIKFDEVQRAYKPRRDIEHDPELRKLMDSTDLRGREKYLAIGRYIRSRQELA